MEFWYTEEWTENVRFSIKVDQQLYSKKSDFQQVDIFESQELGKFLTLDGLMMVNEKDEFVYHDCIVHTPMCVNPNIKNVLIIGGGDGGTARELSRYSSIEKIDMVEIDELVVRASQEFLPITASKLEEDSRIHLYFEDGVAWVANAKDETYDLIIVDYPISVCSNRSQGINSVMTKVLSFAAFVRFELFGDISGFCYICNIVQSKAQILHPHST